ncbi:MAG TPA: 3-phosphoshikimate 1-carboxyvinyltransferase [Dongiaceae bacterium]|nr:3-phosphoshikimate 1-carboxyvinyltransferase [Dongiaceae bacterium]
MPLPSLIEIVPLHKPVQAQITVPGSKSITNRALVLAALAEGVTTLQGALWSEDTQVMAACLEKLGFTIQVAADPEEACNRTLTVQGHGGRVPAGGVPGQPLELFVANAGTAARFVGALVCRGRGVYRLDGVRRMQERPQAALFRALRELGCRVDSPNDKLPAVIYGQAARPGKCRVSLEESSQFASALLLSGRGCWEIEIVGANPDEQPYVEMTRALMRSFPFLGGAFRIEPDASSGSYFLGAEWILRNGEITAAFQQALAASRDTAPAAKSLELTLSDLTAISVRHWPTSGWQVDADFPKFLSGPEAQLQSGGGDTLLPRHRVALDLPKEVSREHDLGDSIMTAAVLAPLAGHLIRLTDLGRLRLQETERVAALRTELTRCGAQVVEQGDTLTILPSASRLHGAEIETYDDHRLAMCFAILGLKVPGIKLKNPSCVNKTFPDFFQKLAAPPPRGLGATILDAFTGRPLSGGDLLPSDE